ncbi:cell adhesion molecule Dscam2-like isoform X2 [Eriocheir sinensis]|uniref:cell adhesion molecule Dscam2-like isoform X2 n=1 Tax=Eriocheir sinensis TaxID=95602 RepID=UPI0021C77395|nr:cell adhesion molecule Dscam2-like isoform X2 [Eriocheir sinensis]
MAVAANANHNHHHHHHHRQPPPPPPPAPPLLQHLLLLLLLVCTFPPRPGECRVGVQEGPQFVVEPPSTLSFLNTTGAALHCAAHGNPPPTVSWVVGESGLQAAGTVVGVREAFHNGTLIFLPFSPRAYRQDVHASTYRCLASSSVGRIVSRTVTVRAVVRQDYEVQVYDEYVISGNTAVLRCRIPTYVQEYVKVVAWVQDDTYVIQPGLESGGKYMILHDGSLHIYRADPSDGYPSYRCRTNHTLTAVISQSSAGRVMVTEPHGDVAPRLIVDKRVTVTVRAGQWVVLPCAAQSHPTPTYRWLRLGEGVTAGVVGGSSRYSQVGGLLVITGVGVGDQGKYMCFVNNSMGHETVEATLLVTEPLSVHVSPRRLVVDMGKTAELRCVVQGHPITSLSWLRNGKALPPDGRFVTSPREVLRISKVGKEDRAMYQCVVASARQENVQAAAHLALGDSSPELHYRFQEQTLQPGPSVSLKCVATGNPPPQFIWTLDGFPLPESERFLVGQYVTVHDDVISHVNITNVRVEDGGEYTCSAANTVGVVTHSAKVNVYGLPFIRHMRRVSAVAGSGLRVKCPVAGYPIDKITWEKDGRVLPTDIRQRVFENGTLVISQTQRDIDGGRYTCRAINRHGHSASRDVTVTVTVPPKIMPFSFANNILSEGNRASLTCQILEGDLPVNFRWEKDGGPVPIYDGITTRLLDDYQTQLVIDRISSRHNGEYTCVASNSAATRHYTTRLTVNVPPHWVTEPQDSGAAQGSTVTLNCQADGYPTPTVTWKKAIMDENEGSSMMMGGSSGGSGGRRQGGYQELRYGAHVEVFSNGSVVFRNVQKSMEGKYLCQARNGISAGLSKVVYLTVNAPAHFPEKMGRVVVRLGQTAVLRCPARGDRPIDILWSVDGRRLDPHADPRVEVREETSEEGFASKLTLTSAARSHSATYTCHAANAFGRDTRNIELIVQEEPEQPKNLRVVETHSRRVKLSWMAPYNGNAPIQNYLIQYKLASEPWPGVPERLSVPGDQTEGVIHELTPATAYHLRVTAQNTLGLGTPSEVIQAATDEEEPSGPPLDVRVTPESSTSLRVTWEPPARDLWNGNILGYYVGYRAHALASDYNFQTVEVGSAYGGSSTLSGLQQYTRYEVVVQAFNNRGAGPLSPPVIATTEEDAPSLPPETIRCEATSPQSISVAWRPPPLRGQNGLIKGYRVLYTPASDYSVWMDGVVPGEWKKAVVLPLYKSKDEELQSETAGESTNIFNLEKYTNYSISVLAYTSAGDGVPSSPVFCRTLQDVPESPAGIKAVVSSPSTILVTWLAPAKVNGVLTKYTLYMAITADQNRRELPARTLGPGETSYMAEGVSSRETYEFWVSASTQTGEGPPTDNILVKPTSKVSAQIASFGGPLEVAWKEDVRLQCHSVGEPPPEITWTLNGKKIATSDRIQERPNGSLFIRDVQKTDAGNLTCSASNTHGKDSISYLLKVQVPPAPPTLYVQGSSRDALTLRWSLKPHHAPVRGYIMNYKREYGNWEEVELHTARTTHTLSGLVCGSRYQLYVTAYNKVGTGLPSEILTTSTKGSEPVVPGRKRLLDVNSTSILVHLSTWGDGGCPILYYVIEYRAASSREWISVANNVAPNEKTYVIRDLTPATRYTVKVTAHNHAGSSVATYDVSTLTLEGVLLTREEGSGAGAASPPLYQDLRVVIPAAVVVVIVIEVVMAVVCVFRRRKMRERSGSEGIAESPSTAQIQNQQNQHQQYSALPPTTPSTQDTATNKESSGNGTVDDYIEDICPYATFQLPAVPKSHYGESTDSGIVYSGPYHSVQGAFVYHDPKRTTLETFPLRHKEPEYTKVRRKGRRDPHVESTESDNLGSTDSEVKKILSLHMPISEYDTLGSDSEGPGTRDSPPTFAESAGLAHAHIHPHPAHSSRSRPESAVSQLRSSTDIFKHRVRSRQQEPSKSQENSSSSTDTSSSGRRAHPRRGKKSTKRQSRSTSRTGFEETSFSHASPADRLSSCRPPPPPPPRGFSDSRKEYSETECDRGGKRSSSSAISSSSSSKSHHLQQKYYKGARPRESGYQINV